MSRIFRSRSGMWDMLNQWYNLRTQEHIGKIIFKLNYVPAVNKSTYNMEENEKASGDLVPFTQMMKKRREEAERSVLVQVHSEHSTAELNKYCSQCGNIKGMYHYSHSESLHFVIVEFNHASAVNRLLDNACCFNTQDVIPVKSPFLWFRAPKNSVKLKKQIQPPSSLVEVNGNTVPTQKEIRDWLQAAETLSDQILVLHRSTCLSDLGSRLRFFTARQIELALKGLFPEVSALPFGSSVNGFGRAECDLDLVLLLNTDVVEGNEAATRLVFHAKTALANERTQTQRHMETLADICQYFLPGCSNVRRILNARVPIIKYHQGLTGLEVDLSMTNMTAVYMSELLYMFGELDWRVRPLASAIKFWAREVGITNPTPGRWITNFSLMLLILFYLQQQKPAILPTANALMAATGPKSKETLQEGRQGSLFKHVSQGAELKLNKPITNLETLFMGFFEFYSSFDFDSYAISINNGSTIFKPEHSALYIVNPLEQGLNVSKNVSHEEVERFRIELRNTAWILESAMTHSDQDVPWGLNAVLQSQNHKAYSHNLFHVTSQKYKNERLMDLTDIFDSEHEISAKTEKRSPSKKRTSARDVKRR